MTGGEWIIQGLSGLSLLLGVAFFAAGTTGMLRFPDVYNRLHAMTKADNLGFGFIVLGLAVVAPGLSEAFKLVVTWVFILVAATTAAHLVAGAARREGVEAEEGERGSERRREDHR